MFSKIFLYSMNDFLYVQQMIFIVSRWLLQVQQIIFIFIRFLYSSLHSKRNIHTQQFEICFQQHEIYTQQLEFAFNEMY